MERYENHILIAFHHILLEIIWIGGNVVKVLPVSFLIKNLFVLVLLLGEKLFHAFRAIFDILLSNIMALEQLPYGLQLSFRLFDLLLYGCMLIFGLLGWLARDNLPLSLFVPTAAPPILMTCFIAPPFPILHLLGIILFDLFQLLYIFQDDIFLLDDLLPGFMPFHPWNFDLVRSFWRFWEAISG